MTLNQYRTGVGNQLQTIQQAFRAYQESSNSANSTWNLIGAVWRSGPSQAERDANRDFAHLVTQIRNLGTLYDYPSEKVNELTEQVRQELRRGNRDIDSALRQVYWAAGAIAAAPLAWPILAIGGTTAAVSMGTSLAFSATSIVGNAALATTYRNGDFACNLGRQLLAQGPQAMVQALVGGTLGAVLPGASALTGNALRDIVGERVLNGISLIAVGALVAPGLYHTGEAMISASDLAIMAEAASADGEHELANEYRTLAAQARFSAAQGVASSVVLPLAARYMLRNNFTFDQRRAQQLLGRQLTLAEQRAIERAHRIGINQMGRDGRTPARVGNYTDQQLQDKYNILARAGFKKEDIKKLMDAGVVGRSDITGDYRQGNTDDDNYRLRGGRSTEGTLNNRSGGQSAGNQVQRAGTMVGLNERQRQQFGDMIHEIKDDPRCPASWLTETGDLTWQALIKIAEAIKAGVHPLSR